MGGLIGSDRIAECICPIERQRPTIEIVGGLIGSDRIAECIYPIERHRPTIEIVGYPQPLIIATAKNQAPCLH